MRDIYLIDFENVASEGLSGITYLAPEDQVIIFYSNNSNRLSMKMHILIGKSVCQLDYFEATVGGKNALDHQISTWLGYLVGTNAAQRNYYIVSKDMGYRFVASFWTSSPLKPNVRCVDSIRSAGRQERNRQRMEQKAMEAEQAALEAPTDASELPAEPTTEIQPAPAEEPAAPTEEPAAPAADIIPDAPEETPLPTEDAPLADTPSEEPAEAPLPEEPEAEAQEVAPALPEVELIPPAAPTAEEPPREESEDILPPRLEQTPAEALDDTEPALSEPGRRSSRSRQRYRRGRSKSGRAGASHDTAAEQEPAPSADHPATSEPHQEQAAPQQPQPAEPAVPKARPRKKPSRSRSEGEGRSIDLAAFLAPYPSLQVQPLQQLIADNKRQVLCNTLRKELGQEKGLALYNELKKAIWH